MHGETMVSLRVFGDDLKPDEISRMLGAEPETTRRKGETRILKSGKQVVVRTGLWSVSGAASAQESIEAQISELLRRLNPDLAVWQSLGERYYCRVDCFISMGRYNEEVELSSSTLSLLADRRLSLAFDIYEPLDDDKDRDPN